MQLETYLHFPAICSPKPEKEKVVLFFFVVEVFFTSLLPVGTSLGIVISASPCIFLLECYITAPGALFCQFRESGHYGQYFPFTVAFKMGHRCCTCVVYLLLWVGDSLFIAVYLTSDHVHVVIQGDAPGKCHFDTFLTIAHGAFLVNPPLFQRFKRVIFTHNCCCSIPTLHLYLVKSQLNTTIQDD